MEEHHVVHIGISYHWFPVSSFTQQHNEKNQQFQLVQAYQDDIFHFWYTSKDIHLFPWDNPPFFGPLPIVFRKEHWNLRKWTKKVQKTQHRFHIKVCHYCTEKRDFWLRKEIWNENQTEIDQYTLNLTNRVHNQNKSINWNKISGSISRKTLNQKEWFKNIERHEKTKTNWMNPALIPTVVF